MAKVSGNFTFPVASYYDKSTSFKQKVESFANEVESKFYRVVKTKITSLDAQDQQYIEGIIAYTKGQSKLKELNDKYLPKLNSMQTENGNNPMNALIECDNKYQGVFNQLKDGKLSKEIDKKMDRFEGKVDEIRFLELQKFSREEMIKHFGETVEILKEIDGNDWYERFKKTASLADYINDFSKKADEFAQKYPKRAAIIFDIMMKSDNFTNFLRGTEDLTKAIKSLPHAEVILASLAKSDKLLSKAGDLVNGKFLKFAHRFIGSGAKLGWAGVILSVGINGYYNATSEEVFKDFSEGKAVRGSVKVVAGTGIDVVKNFGVVDGIVAGAVIGSAGYGIGAVPGAIIGGVIGVSNQLAQFVWPDMYNNLKSKTYAAIDWVADTATKSWNNLKTTASNAISKAKDFKDKAVSIGKSFRTGLDKVNNGLNFVKGLFNKTPKLNKSPG